MNQKRFLYKKIDTFNMNLQFHGVTKFCENIIVHYSFGGNDTKIIVYLTLSFLKCYRNYVFSKK